MQDGSSAPSADFPSHSSSEAPPSSSGPTAEEVVSTHVLVPAELVHKLRELARRTRIHQSEYLREAVDDLLAKYGRMGPGEGPQP